MLWISVVNNKGSGKEQSETEQNAGIGHVIKGTEREKNSPFERSQPDVKCSQQVKEEGI